MLRIILTTATNVNYRASKFLNKFFSFYYLIISMLFISLLSSCRTNDSNNLDETQANVVRDSVKMMAVNISDDISKIGPAAWLHYFARSPQFFMANEGKLVFPNYDSAVTFVNSYAAGVRSIQLIWSDLNVDPITINLAFMRASFHEVITDTLGHQMPVEGYFTGLAEHNSTGWQLRNLHWSVPENKQ